MAISLRRALISSRNLFYALRTASIHSHPNFSSHLNPSAAEGQQLKENEEAKDTLSGSNYYIAVGMRSADYKLNCESVELEKLLTKGASPAELIRQANGCVKHLRHLRYELDIWEEWLAMEGSRIEWNSNWMLRQALPVVRTMSAESTEYAKENIKQARRNAILNFEFKFIYGRDMFKKTLMEMLDRKVGWALEEAEKMDAGFRTFMSDCAKTAKYL